MKQYSDSVFFEPLFGYQYWMCEKKGWIRFYKPFRWYRHEWFIFDFDFKEFKFKIGKTE